MGNVLAFCEFQESSLRTSALANLAFARQAAQAHGGEVIALLVGAGAQAASANAAKFAPKVIVVEDGKLDHYLAETYAPILARLAKENNATVVTATATSVGMLKWLSSAPNTARSPNVRSTLPASSSSKT
jgi:electron transfer flavoprotein alpha subunit